MRSSFFTFKDDDGIEIIVYRWLPDERHTPKADVQITHGMGEHAARYSRFAGFLTENGYSV
jgi:alpha-beta hydrolase superfamily lysophospholipase